MTNLEAIEQLHHLRNFIGYENSPTVIKAIKALDLAIKSLSKKEKLTPYISLKFIDDVIENVKLTQEQYDKLKAKFNETALNKNIIQLDNYIVNGKGNKYKDHYRVLNTWCNNDIKKEPEINGWGGYKKIE